MGKTYGWGSLSFNTHVFISLFVFNNNSTCICYFRVMEVGGERLPSFKDKFKNSNGIFVSLLMGIDKNSLLHHF